MDFNMFSSVLGKDPDMEVNLQKAKVLYFSMMNAIAMVKTGSYILTPKEIEFLSYIDEPDKITMAPSNRHKMIKGLKDKGYIIETPDGYDYKVATRRFFDYLKNNPGHKINGVYVKGA